MTRRIKLKEMLFKGFLAGFIILQACNAKSGKGKEKVEEEWTHGEGVFAIIETNMGKITSSLEFEKAPMTVTNFVGLAEGKIKSNKPAGTPFYNGVIFHRVITGFMIQGGDPDGTGMGGPGYKFSDEIHPDLKHTGAGIFSMANSGPNTNGSQFFITHAPTPHLNGRHTVFGNVVDGMDVVNKIAATPTAAQDRPTNPVVMEKVTIKRVGAKAQAFMGDQAAFDGFIKAGQEKQNAALKDLEGKEMEQAKPFIDSLVKKHGNKLVRTTTGLMFVVLKKGKGEKPKKGANIKAHYIGKFLDGSEFDNSVKRGQPIQFPVGSGRVIPGWDEALMDMQKGEKRLLVIPSKIGYGSRGVGPIKPYSTLVFEVELVEI